MNNIELESIHSQAFHELAMNYRGAPSGEGAATAYAQLTAYIDERMASCCAQQREDERLRIKEIDDAYQRSSGAANWQERAEKAEAELEEWRFTNKIDESQRAHDGLLAQLAARPAVDATVKAASDIARCYDLGTPEGHAIADAIESALSQDNSTLTTDPASISAARAAFDKVRAFKQAQDKPSEQWLVFPGN